MLRSPRFVPVLLFALAARAPAQDVLLEIADPNPGGQAVFGLAIGDWDGDGIDDVAIGAPQDSSGIALGGAVRIHSGKDGSVLKTYLGPSGGDLFGAALARIPDLDGDGFDDFAVAAPLSDFSGTDTGSVFLYAGRTGTFLRRIDGPVTGTSFGSPLGAVGDIDGDGICDLFIAASGNLDVVHLHSGADGHEISTLTGKTGEAFGFSAVALDDLDGDGVRELLIGAANHKMAGQIVGAAYLISTKTGTVLRTYIGTTTATLGSGVASLGDLDGDGTSDYALAVNVGGRTQAYNFDIYSSGSGSLITQILPASPSTSFGSQMVNPGDLNGDGIHDLAIGGRWFGANKDTGAAAYLVSGKTFAPLDRIETDALSVVLSPFGDLNGDGLAELQVGLVTKANDGPLRLYAGDDLWLDSLPIEPLAADTMNLTTREGVPGALTMVALSRVDGVPTFLLLGGVTTFDPTGTRVLSGTVPAGLAGHELDFKAFAIGGTGRVIKSAEDVVDFK